MKKPNLKKYVLILSFLSIVFSSESINAQSDKDNINQHKIEYSEFLDPVLEMPRFPGCENYITHAQKDSCSKEKLMEYLYTNLIYPDKAKHNKTKGTVVIQFKIMADGSIKNIKLARDIGDGCGNAALKVFEDMSHMQEKWIPGIQNGRKVDVLYTVPVKFNLQ